MSLTLGRRLQIRTMVHMAGEPIPNFWPMRTFIHHNPLFGLEHLPFEQAVAQGEQLFHARGYLPREQYQRYLAEGRIDRAELEAQLRRFLANEPAVADLDLAALFMHLLTGIETPLGTQLCAADAADLRAALAGEALPARTIDAAALTECVLESTPHDRPIYACVDSLFGTEIGTTLDELVIKSCLDFFDEGQSSWQMPGREKGLYAAWRDVARHNLRLFIRGLHIQNILELDDSPEGVISHVMAELGVPEDDWIGYFTHELTRLHGWSGFIRWRTGAKHYYWSRRYPADLVDYLAIRMVLGLSLIRETAQHRRLPGNAADLEKYVQDHPEQAFLRLELYGGTVLPELAHAVEDAVDSGRAARIARVLPGYLVSKREKEAQALAASLRTLAAQAGCAEQIARLDVAALAQLWAVLRRVEAAEGQLWLNAHEAHYMRRLLGGLDLGATPPREKRPFAQIMFCIDVRSERIRRHLEHVGDYQTFGIAGFFGVPASFVGLDKGSETHLAPVVVTPKNLVLELAYRAQRPTTKPSSRCWSRCSTTSRRRSCRRSSRSRRSACCSVSTCSARA
jgi:Uncharacterized protein conserved in bacteria